MCVKKTKILNPAYDPHDVLSSQYVEVNCGKCWQCRLERSNGFAFRVLHEVLREDVYPFFVTLTYAPAYRPYIKWKSYNSDGELQWNLISCWNRDHVQRMHKRVRRCLHYYYGIPSSAFKYLCSCERGSNDEYTDSKGKRRIAQECPHYHFMYLLHVPNEPVAVRPLPEDFYDYCRYYTLSPNFRSFFRYLLARKWFYGHVDNVEYCRDVVKATKYITKYLTKDDEESVFGIPLDDILNLYDKDFEDRQLKSHQAKSGRWVCPKPIKFSALCPRSFGSINLGFDYVEKLSSKELFALLTGVKKVCLPCAGGATPIPLPNYYYNKLCKTTKRLHFDRYYARSKVDHGVLCYGCVHTIQDGFAKRVWDNVNGAYFDYKHRSYSVSSKSDFGRKVTRYRQYRNLLTSIVSIKELFRNKPFYLGIYDKFKKLPIDVRCSVTDLTQNEIDEIWHIVSKKNLLRPLARLRYLPEDVINQDDEMRILSNTLKFIRLCRFTQNHLRHIAYETKYRNGLGRTAINNPDLFLTHYY